MRKKNTLDSNITSNSKLLNRISKLNVEDDDPDVKIVPRNKAAQSRVVAAIRRYSTISPNQAAIIKKSLQKITKPNEINSTSESAPELDSKLNEAHYFNEQIVKL
ncbi:MAG: hypothetical protein MHPSP_001109 [Paramarteilia canceri]